MNIYKKLTIAVICLTLGTNALSNIYCPRTMLCKNQICKGEPTQDPNFNSMWFDTPPIANGIYYFSAAMANKAASSIRPNMQCQYRDSEGHERIMLIATLLLLPNTKAHYSNWIHIGDNINYYCSPNTSPPYLSDPRLCPFYSIDFKTNLSKRKTLHRE